MVDDKIVGRYWLCHGEDEKLWLVQGSKPDDLGEGSFKANYLNDSDMTWLDITNSKVDNDYAIKNGERVYTTDFEHLNYPDIGPGNEIIEIEICKSGKVYWYES